MKNPPASAGDTCSIPGSGRSPGKGNGNLLQYSCLENPIDRGAWQTTVHEVARVGHNLGTKHMIKRDLWITKDTPLTLNHSGGSTVLNSVPGTRTKTKYTFITLNPGLPHCRRILYRLSHQGSPLYHSMLGNKTEKIGTSEGKKEHTC